jgi:hypothetical protein
MAKYARPSIPGAFFEWYRILYKTAVNRSSTKHSRVAAIAPAAVHRIVIGFQTNQRLGPSVSGRITCRERLLQGFVNHSFFRLVNVFFSLQPIVRGGTWSVATPHI